MRIFKHIWDQPFIFTAGVSALVHSTWSLATLFGGHPPVVDGFSDLSGIVEFAYWLVPALLLAFSLDVGQISTSAEIRAGQRNWTKFVTFTMFALATYYLQWLYMLHHTPHLPLGEGVSDYWQFRASQGRDFAMWFVPALLPMSTLFYTLSAWHEKTAAAVHVAAAPPVLAVTQPDPVASLPEPEEDTQEVLVFGEVSETDSPLARSNGHKPHTVNE
jgi:hypothetical protein